MVSYIKEKNLKKKNGFRGSKWLNFDFLEVSGRFLSYKSKLNFVREG